jgi:hypothetical protein
MRLSVSLSCTECTLLFFWLWLIDELRGFKPFGALVESKILQLLANSRNFLEKHFLEKKMKKEGGLQAAHDGVMLKALPAFFYSAVIKSFYAAPNKHKV